MNTRKQTWCHILFFFLLVLSVVFCAEDALAAGEGKGILDGVTSKFQTAASAWKSRFSRFATNLFWGIAVLHLVWTSAKLALEGGDLQKFLAHTLKLIMFFGFFYFLLMNAEEIAKSILTTFTQLAKETTNLSDMPSGIIDSAFALCTTLWDKMGFFDPVDSIMFAVFGLILLLLFSFMAANFVIEYSAAWVLLYGGMFFLGFGATSWTSDMAINYFKAILGCAVRLLAMLLVISVGLEIMNGIKVGEEGWQEASSAIISGIILFMISNKVPPMLSGIIGMGGGSSSGTLGMSSLMGAAGLAMGAGMLGLKAAGMAGGGISSVMQKMKSVANAASNVASGGGGSDGSSSLGGGSSDSTGGGSRAGAEGSLAGAMGGAPSHAAPVDSGSGSSGSFSSAASSDSSSNTASGGSPSPEEESSPASSSGIGSESASSETAQSGNAPGASSGSASQAGSSLSSAASGSSGSGASGTVSTPTSGSASPSAGSDQGKSAPPASHAASGDSASDPAGSGAGNGVAESGNVLSAPTTAAPTDANNAKAGIGKRVGDWALNQAKDKTQKAASLSATNAVKLMSTGLGEILRDGGK